MLSVLFILTCLAIPPVPSPPAIALLPARIAFALGAAIWILTFLFCLRAFANRLTRPSLVASLSFFLVLGFELGMVAAAAGLK